MNNWNSNPNIREDNISVVSRWIPSFRSSKNYFWLLNAKRVFSEVHIYVCFGIGSSSRKYILENDCRHLCRQLSLCDLYHSITHTKFPNYFIINTHILRQNAKSYCRIYFRRLHHPHIKRCNVLLSIWQTFKSLLILLRYLRLCLRLSHDGISERMMRKVRYCNFQAERFKFLWKFILIHTQILSLRSNFFNFNIVVGHNWLLLLRTL